MACSLRPRPTGRCLSLSSSNDRDKGNDIIAGPPKVTATTRFEWPPGTKVIFRGENFGLVQSDWPAPVDTDSLKAPHSGPEAREEATPGRPAPVADFPFAECGPTGSMDRHSATHMKQLAAVTRSALSRFMSGMKATYSLVTTGSPKVSHNGPRLHADVTVHSPPPLAASTSAKFQPTGNLERQFTAPAKQHEKGKRTALSHILSGTRIRYYYVRQRFKDFVNRLASVKEENGTKYLILRNEYVEELDPSRRELSVPHYSTMEETDSIVGVVHQDRVDYFSPPMGQTVTPLQWRQYSQDYPMVADECPPLSPVVGVSRIHSSPCLLEENCYEDVPPPLPQKKHSFGGSPKRPDMPLPPPRGRKNHGRRGSQVEERVRQFSVEKELEGNVSPKEKTIQDVTVSPGTVKEKTQIINRMAESSGVPAKPALPSGGLGSATSKRREGPGARAAPDDDTTSVNTLDPRRREWLLRAAQTDYHSLVRLLREDPDLYRFEDFTSGYTALHWAAKYGSAEIVKLIAGSYGLNPNVKTHGGYTPLHLAYMFNQYHIAELLRAYGADANARDNSGRKPCQYQKGGIPQPVKATMPPASRSVPQPTRNFDKDLGFMRMGSFNSRVKRTAAALTNPFGVQKLKPWGSADSVADGAPPMGPPKGTVKKKKSKKVIDFSRSVKKVQMLELRSACRAWDRGADWQVPVETYARLH